MKKLLSVILTVAILVSCIAPSLATFAVNEPALVIADASFDPAARDASVTTTVSIANNPGFSAGTFYLYYDSAKLDANEGAVTSLLGDDYTVTATYDVDVTSTRPSNAFEDAGLAISDSFVCVEIEIEGDANYTGYDLVSIEFDVVGDFDENDTTTVGIAPGVGKKDSPMDEEEEDVIIAAGEGTFTAVADPNTPVYEDKQFKDTTIYADSVTVNKGVTSVEVSLGVGGTGDIIDEYGFNSLVLYVVYPNAIELVSAENSELLIKNGFTSAVLSTGDTVNLKEDEVSQGFIDMFEKIGFDWENADAKIVPFMLDLEADQNIKEVGALVNMMFNVPADKVGTYEIQILVEGEESFIASVPDPDRVYAATSIPFVVDNGYIKVAVTDCDHADTTVSGEEATCKAPGYYKEVCNNCGEVVEEHEIPVADHVEGDKVITVQPTIDSEGVYEIHCKNCNELLSSGTVPAITAVVFTLGEVTAKYGDTVSLPINVVNNNGMFIATIDVKYDADVLEFVDFDAGEVFEDAYTVANEYERGTVRILIEGKDVANTNVNGLLGNVNFAVADDASLAGTDVVVTAETIEDGIIDTNATTIEAIFQNGKVSITNREAAIGFGEAKAPYGKEVLVPVTVAGNPGMFIASLEVEFDTTKLQYVGFVNGDVFAADNVIANNYADGKVLLYFEAKDAADVTADGTLGYVKFVIADDEALNGAEIPVTLTANAENMINFAGNAFEYTLSDGVVTVADRAKVDVLDVEAKYGSEVLVTLDIVNNPGFFIGIFEVKYDTSVLTYNSLMGVLGENVYCTDLGNGVLYVYVEADENADVTSDAVLVDMVFTVADNASLVGSKTELTVDVVEVINYAGEDVDLATSAGSVTILEREKIVVEDSEAEFKHNVKVPVSVENNTGFWAAGFEHQFDADAFTFVGVEGALIAEIEASVNGNVITVFGEAAGIADIAEDGVLYYLVFAPKAEDSAMSVTVEITEMIDVNANDVAGFVTAAGNVTTVPCDHSENDTYSKVTKEPTAFEEGETTYYCSICDAVVKVEPIAMLEAIMVKDSEAEFKHNVKVPVSVANNTGFWAAGFEHEFDADAFTFVGVEGALIAEIEASVNGNVITVFGEAAGIADIEEDGVLYYLVLAPKAEDSATSVTIKITEMIDVNANDVADFVAVAGNVTTVPCNHSENDTYTEVTKNPSVYEEGETTYYCSICDGVVKTEVIAKLFAIEIGSAAAKNDETVEVPVTILNNKGIWAVGLEIAFDAEVFEYVSIAGGLFTTVEASAANGVVTIFADAPTTSDLTEDGVAFTLTFKVAKDAPEGENDFDFIATIVEDNTINANGEAVTFEVVDGVLSVTGHTHVPNMEAPTCTDDVICTICEEVLVKAPGHTAGEAKEIERVEPADCVTDGYYVMATYCTVCTTELSKETFEIKAPGHIAGEPVMENEVKADCVTDGYYEMATYCTECATELSRTEHTVDALGHTEGEAKEIERVEPADCVTDGYYVMAVYCTECEKELSKETFEIKAPGHTAGEAVEIERVEPADCVTDGYYVMATYCTVCTTELSKETFEIKAPGHKEVVNEVGTPPTCTEPGVEGDSYCEVCLEPIQAGKEIPATGHTEAIDNAFDATCTRPGSTGTTYCTVCNETIKEAEVIPAPGHTPVVDEAVPATCTSTGLTEGSHCEVCEATLVAQQTVAKLDHTPVVDEAVPATCTSTGLTEGSHCADCGVTLVAQTKTEKLDHTPVVDEAVPATCMSTGLTEGSHCADCGATLVAQKVVAKADHTVVVDEAVPATCKSEGLTEGSHCEVCGATLVAQEVTPKLDHTPVVDEAVPATCKSTGLTEGSHCGECGDVIIAQETVPMLEHVAGEVKVENNVAPDCENAGSYENVTYCVNCGTETSRVTVPVDALGHDFDVDFTVDVEAEIGVPGEKSKHCANGCGARTEITEIPALDPPVTEFKLTVNGVERMVKAGEAVMLEAGSATLDGYLCKVFDKWTVVSGNVEINANSEIIIFVMPEEDVEINEERYYVGDVNGDGKVNAKDVIDLKAAMLTEDMSAIVHGNVNGDVDGKINAKDVIDLKTIMMEIYEYPNYI